MDKTIQDIFSKYPPNVCMKDKEELQFEIIQWVDELEGEYETKIEELKDKIAELQRIALDGGK